MTKSGQMFSGPRRRWCDTSCERNHALAVGLFGLLRPGEIMLSVTGRPYDTLDEVIGGRRGEGSLADFGIEYKQIELADGRVDYAALAGALKRLETVSGWFMSRGRDIRPGAHFCRRDKRATDYVHRKLPGVYVVVDNCYGEFTEEREPRADLIIGSLIKNPGGGMAENGGYIADSARAVELASYRLTTVGTGSCVGASLGQTKNMLKGLFYAPHTTAQALKTAHFAAYIFKSLGYRVDPYWDEVRSDIIQTVECGSPEALCAFCRGIQSASPIDSFVTPEPWKMPGYADPVIMAAGTFVQGAAHRASPRLRPPYTVLRRVDI